MLIQKKDVSFEVSDYVHLRVFPLRGMKRLHVDSKLSPRYIGPYMITRRIGKSTYELELPQELIEVHPMFHVSQLRRCIMLEKKVSTEVLDLQGTLEYLEFPFRILDTAEKSSRNNTTRLCKVQWSNHTEQEATWEKESVMMKTYPHLFGPKVSS
jgi:hypothetical protein